MRVTVMSLMLCGVVLIFDTAILYKDEGVIEDLKASFRKRDGKIYFSFVGDPSSSYVHDYAEYMRLITQQIMVTPMGRAYFVERVHKRCGNLFIKYTYCQHPPISNSLEFSFNFWVDNSEKIVIVTWDYMDDFFSESKFATLVNPIVSFRRKFIELDKRFFDLLYGHCLRSGDKSFNLNEVFSAALTFSTRMSINGNDIRAINRVPSSELLNAVVAVYCIAYKERFNAGKKLERFLSDEQIRRASRKIGFTDFVKCAWRVMTKKCGLLDRLAEAWNDVVESLSKVRNEVFLDIAFFESVRCVEMSEFLDVTARYTDSVCDLINNFSVESMNVEVNDGMLVKVVDYVKRNLNIEVDEKMCDRVKVCSSNVNSIVDLSKKKKQDCY